MTNAPPAATRARQHWLSVLARAPRAALAAHAELLDVHSDEDHNRSVYTLVGSEDELVAALLAGIACARERIDLRRHEGYLDHTEVRLAMTTEVKFAPAPGPAVSVPLRAAFRQANSWHG